MQLVGYFHSYNKIVFNNYFSPLLCITQILIHERYNFSKPTGLQNTKQKITFYFMFTISKCIQNLLKESLRNQKHETVYERCKDVLVPSIKQFAAKRLRRGLGKAARILDPGSR